ncbi:MAG: glycosyltransferase family 2 protein [Lachnospiraceae bacterium]|nr:glycosyltransferase family 2 protein [Lachnospiraceae bacterium]
MNKILTVSVAAYNVSDTIATTLDSLITDPETMNRMEVIVVNDGSRDDTSAKVNEYVERYPDTFRLIDKENGGYGSTINTSIKLAKGKYFKELDGGDTYETANLPDFINYLENTDADIIINPYKEYYIKDEKTELKDDFRTFGRTDALKIDDVTLSNRPGMHGMAFKTSVWNEYKREIPEHCFYTDTEYVAYPFAKAKTIAFYDKPLYIYFMQCEGQSVSIEGIAAHYRDSVKVMWDLCDAYEKLTGQNELTGNSKTIFEMTLNHVIAFAYTLHSVLGKDRMGELKETDTKLKEDYPNIYKMSGNVKRIKLMRTTGFKCHGLYVKSL